MKETDKPHPIGPEIHIESLVSHVDGKPVVRIEWGPMSGQLTPGEARAHAMAILDVASAADLDAFVFHWLKNVVGAAPEKAILILRDFREWRKRQSGGRVDE